MKKMFTLIMSLSFFIGLSFGQVTDKDGNVYNIVTIGSQTWLKENLKTTKYNDGTVIPLVTDGTIWANNTTKPAYCNYNNTINVDTMDIPRKEDHLFRSKVYR